MSVGKRARSVTRWIGGLALLLLVAPQATAFEAFDGRLQAHGFYESQFRAINADYSEDWDVTQWYQVFNVELELDLLQDTIGVLDLVSAYVRAEVRYDCIYSRGCGMFRSMNTYGDRSKSLPRRLQNATAQTNSGEIPIRNEGRLSGSTTDPVPLSEVSGFSGLADTAGQEIPRTRIDCFANDPGQSRVGVNCFPNRLEGTKPFDYVFENFADFRFTMVNFPGGAGSGNPVSTLGPWLPKNTVSSIGTLSDRVNPFDNSRTNPVLNCDYLATFDCNAARLPGNGARPFRPIPVFAEDRTTPGPNKIQVVVFEDRADPNSAFEVMEIDNEFNHGDARFNSGQRELFQTAQVRFPGDDPSAPAPVRRVYDVRELQVRQELIRTGAPLDGNENLAVVISSDRSIQGFGGVIPRRVIAGSGAAPRIELIDGRLVTTRADTQARGLFLPSKPLRQILQNRNVNTNWPLNLSENERAWNRGQAQQDEKELKEAYLDIEMFDSRLWIRAGKQQIVWGKTELFRTTDQFNPQDLALATLPSLEESRIALWSLRGVWSFYEVGPFEDVRLELAVNIDDYEASDFGACGEPYTVNLVCGAQFGAFAHGFTGVGVVGVEDVPDPWQSLKGWEIGGRLEWRWDRFSFALSDFWGYADLPSIRRVSTYERNVDTQTGRPLVYQGNLDPNGRRRNLSRGYATDVATQADMTTSLWQGIGAGIDPWEDPFGDLRALGAAQAADPGGVTAGRLPFARDPDSFVVTGSPSDIFGGQRTSCGTSRTNRAANGDKIRYYPRPAEDGPQGDPLAAGTIDGGPDCLTAGPTQLFDPANIFEQNIGGIFRGDDSDLAIYDPNDPNCTPIQNPDGTVSIPSTCPYQPTNALDSHHANLTIFTWLCAATVGFLDLDRTSCAQTVFGSSEEVAALAVSEIIGRILAGDPTLNTTLTANVDQTCRPNQEGAGFLCDGPGNKGSKALPYAIPIVQLSNDPGDLDSLGCQDFQFSNLPSTQQEPCGGRLTPIRYLGATLSPEQEALLGCGPFWGTGCDVSGIDLLNMEPSIVLQAFAGASGTLDSIRYKQQGIYVPGTEVVDPTTGQLVPFKAPNEYRTDEGVQPGTLPWEVAGIGGPLCSTADIGGNYYPRGQERIDVPTGSAARPATRKEALPGCHRKWVDRMNGYINLAWGQPVFQSGAGGNLVIDPSTGLPLQSRGLTGNCSASGLTCTDVQIDFRYYSGDPDPVGVVLTDAISFPDSVFYHEYDQGSATDLLLSPNRPAIGPGHPMVSKRAQGARPETIIPFASEMAGLSWNFQMLAVAFSPELVDGLETVGDLADPDRAGCDPAAGTPGVVSNAAQQAARRACGARLEGGSIPLDPPVAPFTDPGTLGANRRYVAQLLFGYCGSEYGVIDPGTGMGTCRIDDTVNNITELSQLYRAEGISRTSPTFLEDSQRLFDSLQFPDVATVEADDPTDLRDQNEGIAFFPGTAANPVNDYPDFSGNLPATGRFNIIRNQHCSFVTPQYCSTVRNLFFLAGLKRNTLAAGGNGRYGRRTMQWHAGGEITLRVPKRNVLGFAMDFAEDRSKANFSIEATWIEGLPTGDADEFDNQSTTDTFNFTVSVDRPTFVNFINPNRTLFINTQWFFQYRKGTKRGFGGNGPFNVLATLTVFTGYFQDRLNPSVTAVYDIQSGSGALLPSITYRFTENFSAQVGAAAFFGREQRADIATNGIGPPSNEQGDWAYQTGAQNGISIVRDRDEVYLRLRYTF